MLFINPLSPETPAHVIYSCEIYRERERERERERALVSLYLAILSSRAINSTSFLKIILGLKYQNQP